MASESVKVELPAGSVILYFDAATHKVDAIIPDDLSHAHAGALMLMAAFVRLYHDKAWADDLRNYAVERTGATRIQFS